MWGVQNVLGLFPLRKAPRAGTRKTMASLFPGPSNKAHSVWQLDWQDAAGLILLWGLLPCSFMSADLHVVKLTKWGSTDHSLEELVFSCHLGSHNLDFTTQINIIGHSNSDISV